MANDPTYDISQYTDALEDAKDHFEAAVKGKDVRAYIVEQCDATIDLANAINDNLNDAVEMSLAVPDTTLTQEGKPAEAKATGDAINAKLDRINQGADEAVALGRNSTAVLNHFAMGDGAKAGPYDFIALGSGNKEHASSTLFTIGNGEYSGSGTSYTQSNALEMDWDGNTWVSGDFKVGGSGVYDPNAKTVASTDDVYGTSGTFAAASGASLTSGSKVEVKQVGKIVFMRGDIATTGTWSGVSTLGTISGVSLPSSKVFFAATTSDEFGGIQLVYLQLLNTNGQISFSETNQTARSHSTMKFQCFYFVD